MGNGEIIVQNYLSRHIEIPFWILKILIPLVLFWLLSVYQLKRTKEWRRKHQADTKPYRGFWLIAAWTLSFFTLFTTALCIYQISQYTPLPKVGNELLATSEMDYLHWYGRGPQTVLSG